MVFNDTFYSIDKNRLLYWPMSSCQSYRQSSHERRRSLGSFLSIFFFFYPPPQLAPRGMRKRGPRCPLVFAIFYPLLLVSGRLMVHFLFFFSIPPHFSSFELSLGPEVCFCSDLILNSSYPSPRYESFV